MTKIHKLFVSWPTTVVGDEIDPEIARSIAELHDYGYIYRWLDVETGEIMSATTETPPRPESSLSQSDSWMRYQARFPKGPLPFPDGSWQEKKLRERALEGLNGRELTE